MAWHIRTGFVMLMAQAGVTMPPAQENFPEASA